MEWISIGFGILFAILGLGCLLLTVLGLPGNWLLLALGIGTQLLVGWLGGAPNSAEIWWAIGIAGGLAIAGEVLETLAGAAGTRAGGGTGRGMVGAVIGGILGSIVFTPLIPIPLVGTLIGAVLGTFVGALVAELTQAKDRASGAPLQAAVGATIGRLLGSMGKTALGATMWVLLTFALLLG